MTGTVGRAIPAGTSERLANNVITLAELTVKLARHTLSDGDTIGELCATIALVNERVTALGNRVTILEERLRDDGTDDDYATRRTLLSMLRSRGIEA